MNELIDLNTLIAIKKATPTVTGVSYGHAKAIIEAMVRFVQTPQPGMDDGNGQTYWETSVKILSSESGIKIALVGRACREMGLMMIRKGAGYYVAFSKEQLSILTKYFNLS